MSKPKPIEWSLFAWAITYDPGNPGNQYSVSIAWRPDQLNKLNKGLVPTEKETKDFKSHQEAYDWIQEQINE